MKNQKQLGKAKGRNRAFDGVCVLKFGSSVLRSENDYPQAALEIYRHIRQGEKVIAVVSALEGQTDGFLSQAERLGGRGRSDRLTARLIRLGELQSAALMALALENIGVAVQTLDPEELGLIAEGPPLDSSPVDLDQDRFWKALEGADALVVPGFIAAHPEYGIATLGRGGTDLSAVFIAARLGANRVRLIKDVDGVYAQDPAVNPRSERFSKLSFGEAERTCNRLIQLKAIHEAEVDNLLVEVACLGADDATQIGNFRARKTCPSRREPLRVLLLGCGSVGAGVLAHLKARPDLFELGPILIRRPEIHCEDADFKANPLEAMRFDPDILIEAIGGLDLASDLIVAALLKGVHVITANKTAVAAHWDEFHRCASLGGSSLRFSAAVGGSAPILEAIRHIDGKIIAIEGVMNGTCNHLLSRLGEGAKLDPSIEEAQESGFAEADPSADLDGDDAAAKLSILIRKAFGVAVGSGSIERESLKDMDASDVRLAAQAGAVIKQVGSCRLLPDGSVHAEVKLKRLAAGHPLAHVTGEQNCFLVTLASGEVRRIFGKGAGRWPTAASVFSDVMDAQRVLADPGARRRHEPLRLRA
jgi:homoserine dehydrogenase